MKDRLELWMRLLDAIIAGLIPSAAAAALDPKLTFPQLGPTDQEQQLLLQIGFGTVLQFAAFRLGLSSKALLGQRLLFEGPPSSSARQVPASQLRLPVQDQGETVFEHAILWLRTGVLLLSVLAAGALLFISGLAQDALCGAFLMPPVWLTFQAVAVYVAFLYRCGRCCYEHEASTGRIQLVRSVLGLRIVTVVAEQALFLTLLAQSDVNRYFVAVATQDGPWPILFPLGGARLRGEALQEARHAGSLLGIACCKPVGVQTVELRALERRPCPLPPLPSEPMGC